MGVSKKAIYLIISATILTAIAQILFKFASTNFVGFKEAILNPYLIVGLFVYGLAAIFMLLSFKEGEVSAIYPFVSLAYIWVVLLSTIIFGDIIKIEQIGGILLIIGGVSFLGFDIK